MGCYSIARLAQLFYKLSFVYKCGRMFSFCLQVYKGYVDDPRNTDNSWMETVAVNFHDDTGEVFNEFKLQVSLFHSLERKQEATYQVTSSVLLSTGWR